MSLTLEALLAGAAIGLSLSAVFLGGLALTVRRLPRSTHPGLLALASFAVRATVVVGTLGLVARQSPVAFVVAFGVFMVARILVVRAHARPSDAVAGE